MTNAEIVNVAWRRGGQSFLATYGQDGTPPLRDAIADFARYGGASVVNDTIVSLFGYSDKPLSDTQVGTLADRLVEDYKP